jgi:hypothetical protein
MPQEASARTAAAEETVRFPTRIGDALDTEEIIMSIQSGWTSMGLRLAATVAFGAASAVAGADTLHLSGLGSASTEGLGKFGATLDYAPSGVGTGTLTVTLFNASPEENGGYLTGFAFNFVSSDPLAKAMLQPGAAYPFQFFSGKAAPFGRFMAGAALGGSWQGGGNPTFGIPVGEEGTFVFTIIAVDAAMLTSANFASGPNPYDFVVRFKGFEDGGSDKVPGVEVCPCDLNYDGVVDFGDVQVVFAQWGKVGDNPADLNGDGFVDQVDLTIVLECWRDCAAE